MDFGLSERDDAFRDELRAFLKRHHPGREPRDGRLAFRRQWAATLADEGWAAPAWPKEWGGMDLPLTQQLVYHEEMTLAAVPPHPAGTGFIVAPTIIRHGTLEQKQRFLKPLVRADELWCQGFSEPGSGSDLPSLRTRAERDGDDYIVTGQKVWTSSANIADWMFALVRTGSEDSRQHGITYLLLSMHSPGITVRPLRDMAGDAAFAEVFFEEVRVPVSQRVGEENGGWAITRTSLGHERSTAFIAGDIRYRRVVRELSRLAGELGRAEDPVIRQGLADMEIAVRILGLNGMRVLSSVLAGGEPGPASSVNRLAHAQFEKRLHELATAIIGPYAMLGPRDEAAVQKGRWVWGFLRTRASTIGAGTAEIQRNTIAEQVLGLPRTEETALERPAGPPRPKGGLPHDPLAS